MEKDFHKEFKKCPVCLLREELAEILGKPELKFGGGENRFLEQLGNELKERGLAREEWDMHFQVVDGPVIDETKVNSIPIGSEVPGFGIITDICMDCGCIYAVVLNRTDIEKPSPPIQIIQPNRAERRRDAKDGIIPPFSLS